MIMRKYLFQTLVVLFAATIWVGCDKDDDNETTNTYKISGTANGSQEVPAVSTPGAGTVSGTYNKQTKMLDYTVTWSNVSDTPTMMHFHGPADPGANAGVMIPITDFTQDISGSKPGMATLTPAQDSALLAGKMYYNLHTPLHPGGEIRAQITATAD
jgi:hypothetical protein